MEFNKMKRTFIFCIATVGIVVIVFVVNIGSDSLLMTEKNVRTQLEQMYDAEVAEVKKSDDKDVYEAIIAKSGQVYLVEMNATTGDVSSLKHTDEFIIEEIPVKTQEVNEVLDMGPEVSPKNAKASSRGEIVESNIISSNGTSKLVIIEKSKDSSAKVKVVENPNVSDNKKSKQTTADKVVKTEEKPIKKVIKDAIKEVLASETTKPVETSKEDAKKETKKENTTKTEISNTDTAQADVSKSDTSKVDANKADTAKNEPSKTNAPPKTDSAKSETSKSETTVKTESSKAEEQQKTETSDIAVGKTDEKKTEVTEKPVTVLITADEALKIAQQQQKGTVDSNSFVKTDEGGYYLIVMTATKTEETKESTKEKKTKATIQVHAISGKILSVTWE
ncbi:PepSY domain-containing protein [Psychrobacillus sp. FSL K6-1415]|uniref:PepSY domain-containing protein n=1 Tax=Psychrobacillus sp. FSL K6-1415 TaxID=2921544 RepID=UPI0030F6EBEF